MASWPAIYKTVRLCVCLLLLSMLGLFHYTQRQHGNRTYMAAQTSFMVDDRSSDGTMQWRVGEGRSGPHRVLASNGYIRQEQITAGISDGGSTSHKTSEWKREKTATSQTKQAANNEPVVARMASRRPKPLPRFNIDNILQPSNDIFYPHVESRSEVITSLKLSRKPTHSKKLHSSSNDILSPRTPGGGYVVVLRVYEQQTMASGNLLQLQCWASMLNMSLVTPFMKLSTILTPLAEARHKTHLSLWDIFNKTHWHEHTQAHGYLPLVGWEDWVKRAPRKLVIVQFKHPILSQVKEKKKQGIEFPHPRSGDAYKKGCEFKFISGKTLSSLRDKGFLVVRRVCFNFQNGDGFTFTEFRDHLFGMFNPGNVSVIIDMWRGLNEPQRVLITDKICREEHPFREQVQSSGGLIHDAQIYKEKFLGPDDYIAVITRFEMTGLSRQHEMSNDSHAEIPRCIEKTLSQLNQLRTDTGIVNTFLSIDIGKYGSSSFSKKKYYHHLREMTEFVRKVHRGRMIMADTEHMLEHVSRTRDSGYIASLQQLIVTRAKCILFMGGGSFQRHALHMYQELHPHIEEQCIRVVESCTNPNRPIT